jgi:hypothetical protein
VVEAADRNRLEVVVAHYKENLEWLPLLGPVDVLTIYMKGGPDCPKIPLETCLGFGLIRWEELPNRGREAQTYLHHIVSQWDRLADVTVFLQGEPRDHIPNLARSMSLIRMGACPPFHPLCSWFATDDRNGMPNHWRTPPPPIPVGEIYEHAFNRAAPMQFTFGAGAQFAVDRSVIRSKPRRWWMMLKGIFENYPEERGPAHAMERLWPVIFTEEL